MSVELIYETNNPTAVNWLKDYFEQHTAVHNAWNGFLAEIAVRYPTAPDRGRSLTVMLGLVGGFQLAWQGEPAPEGWKTDSRWNGFTPDTDTALGRNWQARIDALPQMVSIGDASEIGMVSKLIFQLDGSEAQEMLPAFQLDPTTDTLYALWPSRDLAPIIDQLLHDIATDVTWEPVLRSDWFRLVEAREAEQAARLAESAGA